MAEMGLNGPVETRFSYVYYPMLSTVNIYLTQSVQHVVVDCVIHKAPEDFSGLRRQDAATRTWLKELNIDI